MTSAAVVDELSEAIEGLLAADLASLDAEQLHAVMVAVQAQRSRLAVAAGEVLHQWEQRGRWRADGSLHASLAIGRDTQSCHRAAKAELRRARLLRHMPHTRAAVLDGRLSIDHVDLFVRYATPARFELFLEHEQTLVEQCARFTLFDDARRALQYWAHLADDVLGLRRERPEPSTLYSSRSAHSGELALDGRLSVIDGEIVQSELQRLMRELKLADRAQGVQRSPAQLRAAALVRMAARSVNAGGMSPRPLFQVIIGDVTARRLCELASGTVVHPDDLAEFIDTAVVESFLFDGPTVVIAKTRQRTFMGALRKAIKVRDRRCQHQSGCPAPAGECDVDHRTPAARGGPTSQFNGRAECIAHNRLPHLHDESEEVPERVIDQIDVERCRDTWRSLRDAG